MIRKALQVGLLLFFLDLVLGQQKILKTLDEAERAFSLVSMSFHSFVLHLRSVY